MNTAIDPPAGRVTRADAPGYPTFAADKTLPAAVLEYFQPVLAETPDTRLASWCDDVIYAPVGQWFSWITIAEWQGDTIVYGVP